MFSRETEYIKSTIDNLDGWFSYEEGLAMHHFAKNCSGKGVIVEIGSWQGKSTICLANGSKCGKKVKVYAIDPHTGNTEHREEKGEIWTFDYFKKNIADAHVEDVVEPIVKMSWDAANDFNHPVEFIFIDGAHDYESVKKDFEDWFPKVIEGGVMAFHDSTWEGVRKVLEQSVYKSKHFKNVKTVLGTTYATKVSQNTLTDRLIGHLKADKIKFDLRLKEKRRALRAKIKSTLGMHASL